MSTKIIRSTIELGSQFFDRLLGILQQYTDEEFYSQFNSLREQREQYLRNQWDSDNANNRGSLFRKIDYDHLITALRQELEPDPTRLNEALLRIVDTCLQFGEYVKGRHLLNSVDTKTQKGDQQRIARIHMMYGYLEGQMNHWEASQKYFGRALKIFEHLGDKDGMAFVYNNLGILAAERWDTQKGYNYFSQAKRLNDHLDTHLLENVNMNLAVILGIRGELLPALDTFDNLLDTLDPNDSYTRANVLINKGVAAKDNANYTVGQHALEEALSLADDLPNKRLMGLANLGLADIHVKRSQFEIGLEYTVTAFKIFSRLHDRMCLADTYRVFGVIYRHKGYYKLAESQFQISISLNKEFGNLQNLAETYTEYSLIMKDQKKYELQREYLEKALYYYQQMRAPKRIERLKEKFKSLKSN